MVIKCSNPAKASSIASFFSIFSRGLWCRAAKLYPFSNLFICGHVATNEDFKRGYAATNLRRYAQPRGYEPNFSLLRAFFSETEKTIM